MNGDCEARRPKVESRRSVGPKSNQVASDGKWDVGRRLLCPRLGHLFFAGQKTLIFGRFFTLESRLLSIKSQVLKMLRIEPPLNGKMKCSSQRRVIFGRVNIQMNCAPIHWSTQ
jgi:hypothetical protein